MVEDRVELLKEISEVDLTMPQTWLVGSETRLMHCYVPEIEQILLPAVYTKAGDDRSST